MNEKNRSGEWDPQLQMLSELRNDVREMRGEFKDVRKDMADGRERFASLEGRMVAVEKDQALCPARVEASVRKVLAEQRDTDRIERDGRSRRETRDEPTDEQEPSRERISIGGVVKLLGGIAAAAAVLIGAYFAGRSQMPAPQQATAQSARP